MSVLARLLEEFSSQSAPAAARLAAAQALREHSLPTQRDENWRYANVRAIEQVRRFLPDPTLPSRQERAPLPPPLPGFERLVYVNGRLEPSGPLPVSAQLTPLGAEWPGMADEASAAFEDTGDGRLGLIARMFAPEPLALRVSGTLALELISVSSANANAHYTDRVLELAAGARVELIERDLGGAAPASGAELPAFGCSSLRLRIGAGAQLVHTRLEQATGDVLHYDTVSARLAEQARYQLRHIAAGGASARSSIQVQLQGREATVDIRALAAAQGTQYADALYTVLHQAPGTHSELVFRGIASDRAHVACSADVQVAPGAPGARVRQSLRGLIDGKGAQVNLRPRLTINTDDIQATHGATTGRLDEDLLFYLLSRGLTPVAARSLLKWALLSETLGTLGPQALRKAAEWAVAARLSDAPAAELLQ